MSSFKPTSAYIPEETLDYMFFCDLFCWVISADNLKLKSNAKPLAPISFLFTEK